MVHHPPLLERPHLISQAAFTFVKRTSSSPVCSAQGNVSLGLQWGQSWWEGFQEYIAIIIKANFTWRLEPFHVGKELGSYVRFSSEPPGLIWLICSVWGLDLIIPQDSSSSKNVCNYRNICQGQFSNINTQRERPCNNHIHMSKLPSRNTVALLVTRTFPLHLHKYTHTFLYKWYLTVDFLLQFPFSPAP